MVSNNSCFRSLSLPNREHNQDYRCMFCHSFIGPPASIISRRVQTLRTSYIFNYVGQKVTHRIENIKNKIADEKLSTQS